MADKWVYFFGDGTPEGDPERKDILGGKGASLAAMSQAGLPVPPGFTISAECCRLFFEAGDRPSTPLRAALSLSEGRWPAGLEEQVRQALQRLERVTGRPYGRGARPLLVSVRSGAAVSMPGMMDTILNCGLTPALGEAVPDPRRFWHVYGQFVGMFARTVANIPPDAFPAGEPSEALLRQYFEIYAERTGRAFPTDPWRALVECIDTVFNSWNNERAITYRRAHDIRGLMGTAVTVQSMFPSEVSGILFTVDPNNLSANEMVVEASFGLGEAVVSGDVTPDNFALDRETFAVKRTTIGRKTHVVAALEGEAAADAGATTLNEAQLAELGRMARRVEDYFCHPADIEWGLAEGKFALLQSRAIRGLEIAQDVEVGRRQEIERLRTLAAGKRRVWVVHNLAETLTAPTPLTWDIVRHFMSGDGGFGLMYRQLGYRPTAEVRQEGFLELICGRIYADPGRAAGLFWDAMPLAYNLDQVREDPSVMESAPTALDPERADGRFLRRLPATLVAMLRSLRLMRRLRKSSAETFEKEVLPPYLAYVAEKRCQDLQALSTAAVIEELHDRRRRVLDGFGPESLIPGFFGGLARAALERMLTQLMGAQEGNRLCLRLTSGLGNDITIEQNEALFQVARGRSTMEAYLERFGHRAVDEMELSQPRWREDPAYLEQMLRSYQRDGVVSPMERHDENARRREQAERDLPAILEHWGGSSLREQIEGDLRDAQTLLPYREVGKHYLMMGYELIRLALAELARRWDLGRDLFFLCLDELEGFEGERGRLWEAVAQRRTRWRSARRLDHPDVVDTEELDSLGLPRQFAAADELTGDAVASGVATGPARIVFDPAEAGDLGTDYILVCPSTDPGWTALFVNARGLVVERGGALSHGAIVARDFGIPAVVCHDATKRVPDGALIRVNGNQGRITIISDAREKTGDT